MLDLWRAQRAYKTAIRNRDRDYAKKRESLRSEEQFQDWFGGWEVDIQDYRDEYLRHRTSHWTRKAVSKLVEVPSWGEAEGCWERSPGFGNWVLTDKGVARIRAAVREESLANTELPIRYVVTVVAVASVLVAIFK